MTKAKCYIIPLPIIIISRRNFSIMMKYLQKIGRSLMLPVACLPAAGILYGIGYWLDPVGWGSNSIYAAFCIKAASAIIDQIPLLFAIGVAIGMADDTDGTPRFVAHDHDSAVDRSSRNVLRRRCLASTCGVRENPECIYRYLGRPHRCRVLQQVQRCYAA